MDNEITASMTITNHSRHLHANLHVAKIRSSNIDTSFKIILTCLANNKNIESVYISKMLSLL